MNAGSEPRGTPDYVVAVWSAEHRWWVRLYADGQDLIVPLPIGPVPGLSLDQARSRCEQLLGLCGMYLLGGWQPTGIRHVRARVRKVRQLVRSGHMGAEVAR